MAKKIPKATQSPAHQNPKPNTALTPGESVIADPADPSINTEATTVTDATESNTTPPAVNNDNDHPPVGPLAGDEVPADQQEQLKKKVPKSTKKPGSEKAPKADQVEVPGPNDNDRVEDDTDATHRDSFTPDQAIAYVATQPDPKAAVDALKRERRLIDVTATYQKLQEQGFVPEEN